MDPSIGEIIKTAANSGPVGSLGDAWQTLIGDRIAHWRLKNAMALQKHTIEESRRLGLKLNNSRIPERYAVAWFEEATKQDEPELQVLFARLLARAAAGDENATDRRLIKLLSQLTPEDASIFSRIYSDKPFSGVGLYDETRSISYPATMDNQNIGWPSDWALALIEHFHPGHSKKSIEHLIRQGLILSGMQMEGDRNASSLPSPVSEAGRRRMSWRKFVQAHAALRPYIFPSELGRSLYDAVKT